jgi:hypothetical protein
LATPPVVRKTTEEDGNLCLVVMAFILSVVLQKPAGTEGMKKSHSS